MLNNMLAKGYSQNEGCDVIPTRDASLLSEVKEQKGRAVREVARLEELETLLEAHPETQRILELIQGRIL